MLKWVLFALALIICILFAVMVYDSHRFVVRRYGISSGKIKKNLRIALLTDLHSVSFGHDNLKLIKAVRDIRPDIILLAGDMYTAGRKEDTGTAYSLIRELSKDYPVYYANGNHEQKTREQPDEFGTLYSDYSKKIKDLGVFYLENESLELPEYNIIISGLEIPFKYYRKFKKYTIPGEELNTLIGAASADKYNILIAHNPEYFDDYAVWGADLTVSGHVHGGLLRLPIVGGVLSPKYRFFPKYDAGLFTIGESKMVLSCGLGTHTLPIRIFNPGELSVIELTAENIKTSVF